MRELNISRQALVEIVGVKVKGQMDRSGRESELMMIRERSRTIINVGCWMGEVDMA